MHARQEAIFRQYSATFPAKTIQKWERDIVEWEKDPFRKGPDPFEDSVVGTSGAGYHFSTTDDVQARLTKQHVSDLLTKRPRRCRRRRGSES